MTAAKSDKRERERERNADEEKRREQARERRQGQKMGVMDISFTAHSPLLVPTPVSIGMTYPKQRTRVLEHMKSVKSTERWS